MMRLLSTVSGSDHPRSRGEYSPHPRRVVQVWGSSPLSRGIQISWTIDMDAAGIIPALAGNTCMLRPWVATRRDHPRSRGEYQCSLYMRSGDMGSSPLSRGILSVNSVHLGGLGIIPALAGNTPAISLFSRPSQDHPRSRGEYAGL